MTSLSGTPIAHENDAVGRYTGCDPSLPGEMQVSIALRKVDCGTELQIVQEGVPSVIPVESCYLGWQQSLSLLADLVEAEISE